MADLMPIGSKPSPPPLVGPTPEHLAPLPGSVPHPANPNRPGFEGYFLEILRSFIANKNPQDITDEWMDMVIRQATKFANKILDNFPEMKAVVALPPSTPLPHPEK